MLKPLPALLRPAKLVAMGSGHGTLPWCPSKGCVIATFLPFSFKVLLIFHVLMGYHWHDAFRLAHVLTVLQALIDGLWLATDRNSGVGKMSLAEGTWSNVGLSVLWYPKKTEANSSHGLLLLSDLELLFAHSRWKENLSKLNAFFW